jgi:thiol:disulfide interchange protein DsbC
MLVVAAGLLASAQLCAETPQEARIRKLVEPRMGENIKVDSVTKTPYAGMYEVRTNGDIFYTDETARYLFVGKVMDLTTLQDLTRARVDQISAIRFSELPLGDAIKTVKGNGKRVMAVFEDPNCPFCRKLHETLKGIDNVTVYTFLLNILSDDSAVKSKNIWCAPDRAQAWHNWMADSKPAPVAPAACITPNEQVLALGRKLRVAGTPTIYFADGSRTGSGFDAASLEAKLNAVR